MSIWSDRVDSWGIPALVEQVRELVDAGGISDQTEQDHLERGLRVAEQVRWTLENIDPTLVANQTLEQLSLLLRSLIEQITSWRSGAGVDQLTSLAAASADGLVRLLGEIPIPASAAEASAEIGSLRRSVGQHRGQMEREVEGFRDQVQQRIADLEAERQALVDAHTARDAESTASLAALRDEVTRLRDEMTTLLSSARTLETNQQATFGQSQTTNQEAFASLLAEARESLDQSTKGMLSDTRGAVEAMTADMADHVESAEARTQKIEELFEIAAETTLIGNYTRNANRERKTADVWRWIAVFAATMAVAVGAWAAVVAAHNRPDWDLLAAKGVLVTAVAAVAAYAASQSSEHRGSQRDAEHVAVQLAALKPYLSDVADVGERDRLLVDIGEPTLRTLPVRRPHRCRRVRAGGRPEPLECRPCVDRDCRQEVGRSFDERMFATVRVCMTTSPRATRWRSSGGRSRCSRPVSRRCGARTPSGCWRCYATPWWSSSIHADREPPSVQRHG